MSERWAEVMRRVLVPSGPAESRANTFMHLVIDEALVRLCRIVIIIRGSGVLPAWIPPTEEKLHWQAFVTTAFPGAR
jgi:hypothetical protein